MAAAGRLRRFPANGTATPARRVPGQHVGTDSRLPDVPMEFGPADRGDFVVTWPSSMQDGSLLARRLRPEVRRERRRIGAEFQVNAYTTNPHRARRVSPWTRLATSPWPGAGERANAGFGIYAQRFGSMSHRNRPRPAPNLGPVFAPQAADGNGVLEPASGRPWSRLEQLRHRVSRRRSRGWCLSFTGPGRAASRDPGSVIANFGRSPPAAPASCAETADCYVPASLRPGPRPARTGTPGS